MNEPDVVVSTPVPADVDMDDKILWGLSARQVGLLLPVVGVLLGAWHLLRDVVPGLVFVIVAAPVGAAAAVIVLAKKDGTSLDRMLWAALRHHRGPQATGVPAASIRCTGVGAVRTPVRGISDEGVVDLGAHGHAVALDIGCVNFGLRSGHEQAMLIASFARVISATTANLQVVVAALPVDMNGHITSTRDSARSLPAGPLRKAAVAHADWMADICARTALLRRDVTVMVTSTHGAGGALREATEIAAGLTGIGLASTVLDRVTLTQRISAGVDPFGDIVEWRRQS